MDGESFILDVHHNRIEDVRLYIIREGNINYQICRTNYALEYYEGETALIIAAKNNNIEIVKLLLESNCNIDLQSINGWTALTFSSYKNYVEIVTLLLEYGSNPNIQNRYGDNSLMYAIRNDNIEMVRLQCM